MSFGAMPSGYVFASRYRIDRVLGTGGMGAVYQAFDQELEIAVALKIIRPDITANATVARDFEQRFKEVLGVRVVVEPVDRGATDRYTGTSTSSKIKRLVDRR